MGRAAGDDFEVAGLHQRAEGARHVAAVLRDKAPAQVCEALAVELDHGEEVGIVAGAAALLRQRLSRSSR